jgi:transcriptional regulator with GAF, ATPase, and Fis domain
VTAVEQRETQMATTFAAIARGLQYSNGPAQTWQRIAELAVQVLPVFAHTAISIVQGGGRIDTPASSDDVGRAVDKIQYEAGEGPCLDAIKDHDVFVTGDLASEDRWPLFSSRVVAETGVRSMLALRLFIADETFGAINFYAESVDGFDEEAEALGGVLAAHAAVAMSAANEHVQVEHLEEALVTNRVIGTAIGILMAQSHVDRETGFRLLSTASQRMNIKLRALAEIIVSSEESQQAALT